jgi:hypothetical protein
MSTRHKFTESDRDWLQLAHIAVDAPDQLAEELARVPPDGFVTHEDARAMAALRIALGKQRWRADLATERADNLKQHYAEREAQIFRWLDNACSDRDEAQRAAKWWRLMFWMLALAGFWGVVIWKVGQFQ